VSAIDGTNLLGAAGVLGLDARWLFHRREQSFTAQRNSDLALRASTCYERSASESLRSTSKTRQVRQAPCRRRALRALLRAKRWLMACPWRTGGSLTGAVALAVLFIGVNARPAFAGPLDEALRADQRYGKARQEQRSAAAPGEDRSGDTLPAPRKLLGTPASPLCGCDAVFSVTLLDVLRLAALANLDIVQARLVVERARNALKLAAVRALPDLTLGSTYVRHEGQIQRTEGNVITVDRDSLWVGGGPQLSVSLAEAIFGPHEAGGLLRAAFFGEQRVKLQVLLDVGDAYFNLLLARRRLARIDETLEFLTSERQNPLRSNIKGLLPFVRDYVELGDIQPADLLRVEVDVLRVQEERYRTLQDLRLASADLCRLLHVDPCILLVPAEDFRKPLCLPGEGWFDCSCEELVKQALSSRPELAENQALIDAAIARLRAANWRPLLPSVVLNYNWGGFGGGPRVLFTRSVPATNAPGNVTSVVLGNSGDIANFDTRTDFDVSLVWRLRSMGLGNLYEQRDARLAKEQRVVQQYQIQDLVMNQVVRASEQARQARERVRVTNDGLFDKEGEPKGPVYQAIRLNFLRIYNRQGLPLEVLDSLRRLSDILEAYGVALTDFDRARFRLLLGLGFPPEAILDPRLLPVPLCHPSGPPGPAKGTKEDQKKDRKPQEQPKDLPPANPRSGRTRLQPAQNGGQRPDILPAPSPLPAP
jgi:outer membrane protein TolC